METFADLTATTITRPRFIAFDGSGNLYVAGGINNEIARINPSNTVQTVIKSVPVLNGPVGVTIKGTELYWSQTDGLYKLSLADLTSAGGTQTVTGYFQSASCLNCLGLLTNGSTVYAARNGSSNDVFTFSTTNGSLGLPSNFSLNGLAMSTDGAMLVTAEYGAPTSAVNLFNIPVGPGSLSLRGSFTLTGTTYAVAVASNGDLYVSNYSDSTVTRIHQGQLTTFIDATVLCHPTGLAIRSGYLYVANEAGCASQGRSKGFIIRATIDES